MGEIQHFILSLFTVDSMASVIARGVLWLVIAVVIILNSNNTQDPEKSAKKLKSSLGFLLLFLTLSSGLLFLLFGYTAQP
jgi:hypothetical protein